MNDLERAVGPALRHLRLHGGREPRKQLEVAAAARVTRGMLSSYERGRQNPSLKNLGRILDALGADLTQLQWAVRIVEAHPEGAESAAKAQEGGTPEADLWPLGLPPSSHPSEVREPSAVYRTVPLPEPLGAREERALGQMIAGFLAYLSYTRAEVREVANDEGGDLG